MFRILTRTFATSTGAQFSTRLKVKFPEINQVKHQTDEILIRGEKAGGQHVVAFGAEAASYFFEKHNLSKEKKILPFGVPHIESFTLQPDKSDKYGFGISMWESSAVSARFNTHWFGLNKGATIPQGFGINKDMLDTDYFSHRNLVNTEEMTLESYLSKMKKFENNDWEHTLTINNVPNSIDRNASYTYASNDSKMEGIWHHVLHGYKQCGVSEEVKIKAQETEDKAAEYSLAFNTASSATVLIFTLLELNSIAPQLLQTTFERNNHIFDDPFRGKFEKFLETAQTKTQSKSTRTETDRPPSDVLIFLHQAKFGAMVNNLSKMLDKYTNIPLYLPLSCPLSIVNLYKNIEGLSFKLPIILNKEYLKYCIGYCGLEKVFEAEREKEEYSRVDNSLDPFLVEMASMLDSLHRSFMSIAMSDDKIRPKEFLENENNQDMSEMNDYMVELTELAQRAINEINQNTLLNDKEKQMRIDEIVEANFLLNMDSLLMNMVDEYENNFDGVFDEYDISWLEFGRDKAIEMSIDKLYVLRSLSDLSVTCNATAYRQSKLLESILGYEY